MALYPGTDAPKAELLIDGTWTDVSSYCRGEGGTAGFNITRGRTNEQAALSAQTCDFVLNNRDGRFSDRNPLSPYFRQLPRNTQMRVSAGEGGAYLKLPYDGTEEFDQARVNDTAAIDITGDIDIRIDVEPATWRPRGGMLFAAKAGIDGDQLSWMIRLTQFGQIRFTWSTNGSSTSFHDSAVISETTGRLAVRVTMDVNNGSGGKVVTFYTAPTIAGPWTALGSPNVSTPAVTLFNSSAPLTVGTGGDNAGVFLGVTKFGGKIYAFQLRNGINGTLVADGNFAARGYDDTSWVDSAGRTWMLGGKARISSDLLRFWGELSSLPQVWDKPGVDAYVRARASGVLRRLTQGEDSLRGSLYRALILDNTTGYWPLEDGSDARSGASTDSRVLPAQFVNVSLQTAVGLPGATGVARMEAQTSRITVRPRGTSVTGTAYFTVYIKMTALPASSSVFLTLDNLGAARRCTISASSTGFQFDFLDSGGDSLAQQGYTFGGVSPLNNWIGLNMLLTTTGGTTSWYARWSNVADESFVGVGPATFPGSGNRFFGATISAQGSPAFVDMEVGHPHFAITDLDFVDYDTARAANAYLGETAGARLARLATEQGIRLEQHGLIEDTEPMNYQAARPATELFVTCAETDGGILAEGRDFPGLTYVTRSALEGRRDLELSYGASHLSEVPTPTDDDLGLVNDVTATRPGGSSARREILSGYTSVQPPPAGVGRYPTSVTAEVATDARLEDIASWRANIGSVDQPRVPDLQVGLHRKAIDGNAPLKASLLAAEVGATAVLSDLPPWMPPDDLLLIVQGYTENMSHFLHEIKYNTAPGAVYNTGVYGVTGLAGHPRYDHGSSVTSGSHSTSTTSLLVAAASESPTSEDLWTTNPASFPFDIDVGGERMTVTGATGATSPQTLTVVRSVNGIVKSHLAGTRVRLALPFRWGL